MLLRATPTLFLLQTLSFHSRLTIRVGRTEVGLFQVFANESPSCAFSLRFVGVDNFDEVCERSEVVLDFVSHRKQSCLVPLAF
jgi:hypothetical protein